MIPDIPEDNLGFSRRESRERWEEENEERERQAQEIARLYPQRSAGALPVENGLNIGPPPTFGSEPLPPLVEHQEEAMFEKIQEMMDSAHSPHSSSPPPPATSALSSSQASSHPISPFTISPNQLSDDKETIERELQELKDMEANKPEETLELSFSISDDEGSTQEEVDVGTKEYVKGVDNSVAIKIDSFRVEETNSPLPLSPITEVSSEVEVNQIHVVATSPVHVVTSPEHISPLEHVTSSPKHVISSPEHVISSPEHVVSSPEHVASSPEYVRVVSSPENVASSPENIVSSPEHVNSSLKRDVSSPDSSPSSEDPMDTLDRELNDLLKFSEEAAARRASVEQTSSRKNSTTPSDIVTPPPMFDTSVPPKPTTEAPKRVVKRAAPPPPKPKPKPVAASTVIPDGPANNVVEVSEVNSEESKTPPVEHEAFLPTPYQQQRSESPDLVTQMEALAYSKSITSDISSMPVSIPTTSASTQQQSYQPKAFSTQTNGVTSKPLSTSTPQQPPSPEKTFTTQSNGSIPGQLQLQAQVLPNTSPQHYGDVGTKTPTSPSADTTNTPRLMEVLGDIKIHRVVKTRWTPKSNGSSAEPSPAQTPDQQPQSLPTPQQSSQTPSSHFSSRAATLPSNVRRQQNGMGQYPAYNRNGNVSTGGSKPVGISSGTHVVARGLGSNGTGLNRYSQPNPYNMQRSGTMPWRSQEELRFHSTQPPHMRSQRLASTPDGSRDYRVQKTMSMPRGSMEDWKSSRTNSTTTSTAGGRERQVDGYQVAYTVPPSSPYDLCSRCHQPLGQGVVLSVPKIRTQYHTKCFVCRVCRGPLSQGGQSTTVLMKNMQPHCQYCVSSENGK